MTSIKRKLNVAMATGALLLNNIGAIDGINYFTQK